MYLQHYVNENKENYLVYTYTVLCPLSLRLFKHPKLPISIKISVTLRQIVKICMTAISPNLSS